MEDLVGQTLCKRYFLRELIGHGGTSDVYLAWDKLRNLELAVKVGNVKFLEIFQKEAGFMKKLSHDNIVPVYDFGRENKKGEKIIFIVMKYIKGMNLRHLVQEHKGQPLGLFEVSQVLAAVCKALSFAHQSKVLHGDIKAANILIARSENSHICEKDVFLTDFGGSRRKQEQEGGGTPMYMAPELITGGSVTEKTDIYSLGVTLYEMLSGGELPFRGDASSHGRTPRQRIAWEKLNNPLPPLQQFNPDLPVSVVAVVEKALNKDPKLRHISILDVFNEFENARGLNMPKISSLVDNINLPPVQPPLITPKKNTSLSRPVSIDGDKYYLLGIQGEMKGMEIDLSASPERFAIGRSQGSDLRLTNSAVSRTHASIVGKNQSYYLCDEGSMLGTYLNGRRISPQKKYRVEEGDQIGIGHSEVFEFCLR